MAKAKKKTKAEQTSKPEEQKKTEAQPASQPVAPAIDTGLAASTAAKLLVHKHENAAAPAASKGESESFKQLKESLHKPVTGGAGAGFLQNLHPTKKFAPSYKGGRQVGHNQTFGADVNRSGVPRRTGG